MIRNVVSDASGADRVYERFDVVNVGSSTKVIVTNGERLTGNPQQGQNEYQLYRAVIAQAQVQDAREMEPHTAFESSYIAARRGYRG